jgi:hypothetical protein
MKKFIENLKEALKQMHKDHEQKTSVKRVWGTVIMCVVLVTYLLDGVHKYDVNEHLFDALLITGGTLLGLDVVKTFKKTGNGNN